MKNMNEVQRKKNKFEQIFKMQISDNRFLVLSKSITGNYSLAQQIRVNEGGKELYLFIKNSCILTDEKLVELYHHLKEYFEKKVIS